MKLKVYLNEFIKPHDFTQGKLERWDFFNSLLVRNNCESGAAQIDYPDELFNKNSTLCVNSILSLL